MNRVSALVVMLALCLTAASAQVTGSQIPDTQGQRMYLIMLEAMGPSVMSDYLTNNVGLQDPDLTTTINQINSWNTANQNLVTTYNNGAWSQNVEDAFLANQVTLAQNTTTYLQNNLSVVGWTALVVDYTLSKNNMYQYNFAPGSNMGASVNLIESQAVTIVGYGHEKITVTRTAEIISGSAPPGTDHTNTVNLQVGTHTNQAVVVAPPNQYVTPTATVALDDTIDQCLFSGQFCLESTSGNTTKIFCTIAQAYIVIIQNLAAANYAYMYVRVKNLMQGPYGCGMNGYCKKNVENWCTASSTVPSDSYAGGYAWTNDNAWGWDIRDFCIRPNGGGPNSWTCKQHTADYEDLASNDHGLGNCSRY